jgi:peptide deformylase
MSNLSITKLPDPILRKKAAAVKKVTDIERKTLADMAETMYLASGVGLAGTQVGIAKQLAVIDVGNGLIKMINPSIVRKEGEETQEEGCLSCPNAMIKVKRAKKLVVDYLNETGEVCRVAADGLFARAIQHELDHLSGKLIVDYAGPIKKVLSKIKRLGLDKKKRA